MNACQCGKVTQRFVDGVCRSCYDRRRYQLQMVYFRVYYVEHREQIRANQRQYQREHRQYFAGKRREYAQL